QPASASSRPPADICRAALHDALPILRLVSARLESGRGAVETAGDRVRVTPPDDFHGVTVVRYRVADATGDPTREVEGVARVTVRDRKSTRLNSSHVIHAYAVLCLKQR